MVTKEAVVSCAAEVYYIKVRGVFYFNFLFINTLSYCFVSAILLSCLQNSQSTLYK